MGYLREELNAPRKESIASTGMTLLGIIWLLKNAKMGQKSVFAGYVKMNIISNTGYAERLRPTMNDTNKRLCELLGICPRAGRGNRNFIREYGRIDILKRLKAKGCLYEFLAKFAFPADFIGFLLDDNGALARVALEYLEGKGAEHDHR